MKNVIQWTTVFFLFVQTFGYSQTENTATISKKEDTVLKKQNVESEIDTKEFKNFIGKYLLVEGDFELEIIAEDKQMYIISPFSKDILIQKNENTLREPTRGVDLERIPNNSNALKFTQNGYETIIERVPSKTEE